MFKRGIVWRRWQRALSGYWNSGLSFAEYCRIHDLKLKAASRWRIRLRPDSSFSESPLEIVHLPMRHRRSAIAPAVPASKLNLAGLASASIRISMLKHCSASWLCWRCADAAIVRSRENLLLPYAGESAQVIRRTGWSGPPLSARGSAFGSFLCVFQPYFQSGENSLLGP